MRRIVLAVAVVAVVGSVPAENQSRLDAQIRPWSPPLPWAADGAFRITSPHVLSPCGIMGAIEQIARKAKVRFGFENMRECPPSLRFADCCFRSDNSGEVLTGMTARQAIDHVMAVATAFRWQEIDEVVVVRPKTAWDDPTDVLNLPVARFDVARASVREAFYTALRAAQPSLVAHYPFWHAATSLDDRRVSVMFAGGTVLNALNALVRAQEDVQWNLQYLGNSPAWLEVSALELSGGSVGVDVDPVRQRP